MTEVSLKEYIESRFDQHDKMHNTLAEGVRVALVANEKRLDGMNEFRQAISDIVAQSISREDYELRHNDIIKAGMASHENLQRQLDELRRRFAIFVGAGLVLVPLAGVIGAAVVKAFGL